MQTEKEPVMEEALGRESGKLKGNPYGGEEGFRKAIEKVNRDNARGEHAPSICGHEPENDYR